VKIWSLALKSVVVAGLVGGVVACSGSHSDPLADSPLAPSVGGDGEVWTAVNDHTSAQSMPSAVFRTVPAADGDDAIRGNNPLAVEFNNCQSRPTDEDDDLKFTYDFDGDGTVDFFGHCRADYAYTRPATARVCVNDRRDNEVCRNWEIRPSTLGPDPTPGPKPVVGNPPSATWQSITVSCGPKNTSITMRLTDPDGDAMSWNVSLTGGTLTSAASGGPVASGSTVTVSFTGIVGNSTVRMDLVDSKGVPSTPVTRFGPSPTCGGQILHILG
jgi:hypothetical protein